MQEVPAETLLRAKIFVDSRSASMEEAGDLIQPIRQGLFDETHICGELGEVVVEKIPGRQSSDEITYFKSVGIAVQDAMAAQITLNNAYKMNIGTEVNF
jgi:ornithine cyclodeaminase/alanine dehydrogenase-like protein (mu-crystallin family)